MLPALMRSNSRRQVRRKQGEGDRKGARAPLISGLGSPAAVLRLDLPVGATLLR